jgi:hypothetical protein
MPRGLADYELRITDYEMRIAEDGIAKKHLSLVSSLEPNISRLLSFPGFYSRLAFYGFFGITAFEETTNAPVIATTL